MDLIFSLNNEPFCSYEKNSENGDIIIRSVRDGGEGLEYWITSYNPDDLYYYLLKQRDCPFLQGWNWESD